MADNRLFTVYQPLWHRLSLCVLDTNKDLVIVMLIASVQMLTTKLVTVVLTNLFPVGWARSSIDLCEVWRVGPGQVLFTSQERHLEPRELTSAEYYSKNINDPWKAVRLELSVETHPGLGRVDFWMGKRAQSPELSSERPLEGKREPWWTSNLWS